MYSKEFEHQSHRYRGLNSQNGVDLPYNDTMVAVNETRIRRHYSGFESLQQTSSCNLGVDDEWQQKYYLRIMP
jgi:hypothetical protein